jgi:hypothetical protein
MNVCILHIHSLTHINNRQKKTRVYEQLYKDKKREQKASPINRSNCFSNVIIDSLFNLVNEKKKKKKSVQ